MEHTRPDILNPDHVRVYGMDFLTRLQSSGFKVEEIDLLKELGRGNIHKYVLGEE